MRIRPETPADNASVDRLVERAFGGPGEAGILRALRDTPVSFASLVADVDDEVVGHALFTLVTVEAAEALLAALALGPVAVLPERQRRGVGSALIRAGIAQARASAHPALFVLGHADYYPRFGFEPARAWRLHFGDDAALHADAFFVLPFAPELLRAHAGRVRYHPAFGDA
jgi:putative acetyltransferase